MVGYPEWIKDDAEATALADFARAWAKYDGMHASRTALFAPFDGGAPTALAPIARIFGDSGPPMQRDGADPKGKAATGAPPAVAELWRCFEFHPEQFIGRTHSPNKHQFLAIRLMIGSRSERHVAAVAFSFAMHTDRARTDGELRDALKALSELFHRRVGGVLSRYTPRDSNLECSCLHPAFRGVDERLWKFGPQDMLGPDGHLSEAWCQRLTDTLLTARDNIEKMYREDHDQLVELLTPCFEHKATTAAPPPNAAAPHYTVDEDITVDTPQDAIRHLKAKGAIVLQGPPGTGKTRLAEEIVRHWFAKRPEDALDEDQFKAAMWDPTWKGDGVQKPGQTLLWAMKQLHPGYSYEDLVQGMRSEDGGFKVKPQLFEQMARDALASGRPTFLILDEINRCNLAAVLGDLLSVLEADERGKRRVQLQYEGALALPSNFYVIGTMNTADRSIALVDFAIRRRFRFLTVAPSARAFDGYYEGYPDHAGLARRAFEAAAGLNLPPNLRLGHSFFLQRVEDGQSFADWRLALCDKLVYEVAPQLAEYDREKLLDGAKNKSSATLFGVPLVDLCKDGADPVQLEKQVLAWLAS